MADAPECIVIGVDNSRWVPIDSDIFRDLCDAIEFYCRAKFNENSDTVVGLYTMSSVNSEHLVYPTGSIDELVAKFPGMNTGSGQVDLLSMFTFGCIPLTQHSLFSQHKNKKKRVILFVAGLTNLSLLSAEETAMACRGKGIAIDVIDLYTGGPTRLSISNYSYGRKELAALIKMRNDNDGNANSHIVHVGSRPIRDALSESRLLKVTPFQSGEQNVNAPECIVIGVDNSRWVPRNSDIFRDLRDAIKYYCEAKFKENSDTVVGLFTMSSFSSKHLVYPTGSIDEIVDTFPRMNASCGQVDLLRMFSFGSAPLVECFSHHDNKKKRLVIFVGGLTNLSMLFAEGIAKTFTSKGIAIDIIDFYTGGPPKYLGFNYPCGRTELEALIKLCNGYDNGNHRFVHVGSRSICEALSSLLKITPFQYEEQNVTLKRKFVEEESSAARENKRRAVEA